MTNAALEILKREMEEIDLTIEQAQVLDPIKNKVERLASILAEYRAKEKAFKAETKALKAEIDLLTPELKKVAQDRDVTRLDGEKLSLNFKGKNESNIDPLELFKFFKEQGDPMKFFGYVKANKGALEGDMGKNVLAATGLVTNDFNKWASIEVIPNAR